MIEEARLAAIQKLKINAVSMRLFEAAVRFRSYERRILGIPERITHETDFVKLSPPRGWAINIEALENLDLGTHWSKIL